MAMRQSVVRRAVGVVVLGVLAGACSGGGGHDGATPPVVRRGPQQSAPKAVGPAEITIAFAGDTHFYAQLARRLAKPSTALGPIARALRQADFTMLNLETAITTRGTKEPKEFNFRAPPSAFRALDAAGVDVVTMANNHGVDYGQVGLRDSLTAIDRTGFPVVGIGRNEAEAFKPYYATVKGSRIAVIGATQVLDDNLISSWTATKTKAGLASAKNAPRLIAEVRRARRNADAVIVYLHWGKELAPCPLPRQKTLARRLVNAGADVIVGGHAHIPLGGGYLKGRYVDYGLGNFFFYAASGQTASSGILEVTLRGRKVVRARWRPALLSGGIPRLLGGAARTEAIAKWKHLRDCTDLTSAP